MQWIVIIVPTGEQEIGLHNPSEYAVFHASDG